MVIILGIDKEKELAQTIHFRFTERTSHMEVEYKIAKKIIERDELSIFKVINRLRAIDEDVCDLFIKKMNQFN